MKIRPLLAVILACLILALPAGGGAAAPAPAPAAAPAPAPAPQEGDIPFTSAFLLISSDPYDNPWWDSRAVVDASGGAHAVFATITSVYYAYCGSNCGAPQSWAVAPVAATNTSYSSLTIPSIALNPQGLPRMVWYRHPNYVYAECSGACAKAASWKTVNNPLNPDITAIYPRDPRYFALDAQGRPRLVSWYYDGFTYATCTSSCTSAASWTTDTLPLPPSYDARFDMAIDSQGNPRIVFADDNNDLYYLRRYSGCNTLDSDWWLQAVETCADLDGVAPITPDAGFWGSGWIIDGYPSLALTSGDDPLITYFARNVWYQNTSSSSHVWAIRFAGGSGGSGTNSHLLYVPFVRKK